MPMYRGIKNCPFCGKKVCVARMSDGDEHWFYIHGVRRDDKHCQCRVFMESEKFRDGAPEAEIAAIRTALIRKWNRRESDKEDVEKSN